MVRKKSALVAMNNNKTYLAIRIDDLWYVLPESSGTRPLYGSVVMLAGQTVSPEGESEK